MSSYSIELSKNTSFLSTLKSSRLQDIPTFHIRSLLQADVLVDPDTSQQLHRSCTQKDDAVESKLKSSTMRSCRVTQGQQQRGDNDNGGSVAAGVPIASFIIHC